MNRWQVGKVRVTQVVELGPMPTSPRFFFKDPPADRVVAAGGSWRFEVLQFRRGHMIKSIVIGLLAAMSLACHAAVDVNQATRAELEAVKGLGPSISERILDERHKGAFKDWQDLIRRVKGVGESNAAKFSADGLTVNGAFYRAATPARN